PGAPAPLSVVSPVQSPPPPPPPRATWLESLVAVVSGRAPPPNSPVRSPFLYANRPPAPTMTATITTQTPTAAAADFLCRGANAGSAPATRPAPPGWRGSGVEGGRPMRAPESEGMARVAAVEIPAEM